MVYRYPLFLSLKHFRYLDLYLQTHFLCHQSVSFLFYFHSYHPVLNQYSSLIYSTSFKLALTSYNIQILLQIDYFQILLQSSWLLLCHPTPFSHSTLHPIYQHTPQINPKSTPHNVKYIPLTIPHSQSLSFFLLPSLPPQLFFNLHQTLFTTLNPSSTHQPSLFQIDPITPSHISNQPILQLSYPRFNSLLFPITDPFTISSAFQIQSQRFHFTASPTKQTLKKSPAVKQPQNNPFATKHLNW